MKIEELAGILMLVAHDTLTDLLHDLWIDDPESLATINDLPDKGAVVDEITDWVEANSPWHIDGHTTEDLQKWYDDVKHTYNLYPEPVTGLRKARVKHRSIKAFCITDSKLIDPLFIEGEFQVEQPECLRGHLHDAVITLKSGNVYVVSSAYLEVTS